MQQLSDSILKYIRTSKRLFEEGRANLMIVDRSKMELKNKKLSDEMLQALETLVTNLSKITFELEADSSLGSLLGRAYYLIDMRKKYLPYGLVRFGSKKEQGLFELYNRLLSDYTEELESLIDTN